MKKFATLALAAVVLASPLAAQQQPARSAQQTQPAAFPGPNMFLAFAGQVVTNLDQGRAALVWDRAAASFKASTAKDRFVADVSRKREQTGKIVSRQWANVARSTISANGRQQPLIVVTFTATTDKRATYNEIVQFTPGPDNAWQLANYTY
ncbi:MAG: DUF4019 domain-containing protein [Novosphingobium sp.]